MITEHIDCDVLVVGGGPAGLAAALGLARFRYSVMVVDSNRPRHSATLRAHGFLTRDGIAPGELRQLGRSEVESYDSAVVRFGAVEQLRRVAEAADATHKSGSRIAAQFPLQFEAQVAAVRGSNPARIRARAVVIATGVRERLPDLPSMRVYYGTALHSCIACDGFDKRDQPLVLMGSNPDLALHAHYLTQFSNDITVLTGGAATVTADEEQHLAVAGIRIERGEIADLEGERAQLSGVRMRDGRLIETTLGFVRPEFETPLDWIDESIRGTLRLGPGGFLEATRDGETPIPGLFAAGDIVEPGPRQLLIAAGDGQAAAHGVARFFVSGHLPN